VSGEVRTLSDQDAEALRRHLIQRRVLRQLEREEITFRAGNELIDRIITDVGADNDEVVARLLRRKATNHSARARRPAIAGFTRKLVAASGRRVAGIEELPL
jgi:hypothetical protein